VVTGAPLERSQTGRVAHRAGARATDLGGCTDLATLAGVLRAAMVVCCGNTGPMHLAAAVGTPVVAVFPPTVPASRWHPWCVPHELLGIQDIVCAGCRSRVCPLPEQRCVADVTTEQAADAVDRLVGDMRSAASATFADPDVVGAAP
jgi:ADP-heptose:LPS heptosyltransferase